MRCVIRICSDMLLENCRNSYTQPPCIPIFNITQHQRPLYYYLYVIISSSPCIPHSKVYQRLKMLQRQQQQHPGGKIPKPPNKTFPTHNQKHQTHSHSPNTHHLALRSANTNPLQVPLSPILIIVSHTPPSPASPAELVRLSALRINLKIFPLGA